MSFLQLLFLIMWALPLLTYQSDLKKVKALDVPEKNNNGSSIGITNCDINENLCDINCCTDKDCKPWEKKSFACSEIETDLSENLPVLIGAECGHGESDPLLCLHHSNSPYLGRFFPEPTPQDDLANYVQTTSKFPPRPSAVSSIRSDLGKYMIPTNVLWKNGFCKLRPVKYLKKSSSYCVYTISEAACEENNMFDLNFLMNALGDNKTKLEVSCLRNGSSYVSLSRYNFLEELHENTSLGGEKECGVRRTPFVNRDDGTCENVVVEMNLTWLISKEEPWLIVRLASVPLSEESLVRHLTLSGKARPDDSLPKPTVYVAQRVSISYPKPPPGKGRGYKIGQPLMYL